MDRKAILNRRFHALLTQKGLMEQKETMLASFGVSSSKELSEGQLAHLISAIDRPDRVDAATIRRATVRATTDDTIKALRSEVLKLITGSPGAINEKKRGLGIPNDWDVLNPFIKRHAGNYLPRLSIDELGKFKKKLFAMRKSDWYWGKSEAMAEPEPFDMIDNAPPRERERERPVEPSYIPSINISLAPPKGQLLS